MNEQQLKEALIWLLQNQPTNRLGNLWDKENQGKLLFSDPGCGCCSGGYIVPPDSIKQTLNDIYWTHIANENPKL